MRTDAMGVGLGGIGVELGSFVTTGEAMGLGDGGRGVGVEVVAVGPPAQAVSKRTANAVPIRRPTNSITLTR